MVRRKSDIEAYRTPPNSSRRRTSYTRMAARAAGATVGLVAGNLPGAVLGYYEADAIMDGVERSEVPQKKIMGKNVNNALAGQSSMKVSGKNKLKRTGKVVVSPYLKKAIKQTLMSKAAKGKFSTISSGFVGYSQGNAADLQVAGVQNLNSTNTAALYPASVNSSGQRSLFNQFVTFSNSFAGANTCVGFTELNFFTPAKILHAASVLFNNKGIATSPYSNAGNLTTVMNATTGVPNTTVIQNLKIDVMSSDVQFRMKNVSNRILRVDIWELGSTLKFQDNNALKQLIDTEAQMVYSATDDKFVSIINNGLGQQSYILDAWTDPVAKMQKLGYKFKGKKRTMVLGLDETCEHVIVGPNGTMDFAQLQVAGVGKVNSLVKGWSVSCIISVVPDIALHSTNVGLEAKHPVVFSGAGDAGILRVPLAIEMKETYKISVPEIAGFTQQAIVAGQTQPLNQRKFQDITFNNISGNGVVAVAGYTVSNDNNPLLEVNAGATT